MPEIITCPQCQRKLQLPENLIGQEVRCPSCSTEFIAQVGGAAPAPPPLPSSPMPMREEPPPSTYEDRPRRRPPDDWEDEEQDHDDRPRRRRRRRRRDFAPHRGGAVLTLGILSIPFACCPCVGIILGIIAITMANADASAIAAGRMDPDGEGMTNAGRICGIIGLCLSILNSVAGVFIRLAEL